MANDARTQFIDGLRVTADHLQHLQDRLRDAMRDVRQTIGLGKVGWGLHVTVAADSVIVTPGVAFAPSGIRLNIDTEANLPVPAGAGPWRVTLKATEQDRASLRVGDKPTLIQLITSVAIEPANNPAPGEDALVIATVTATSSGKTVAQDPAIFAVAGNHAHSGTFVQDAAGRWHFDGPNVQGAQGPKGDKGAKGDKGDPGAQGSQGAQGAQGPQGAQGSPGAAGAKGDKGDPGAAGAAGAAGAKGDKGDAGAQGAQGLQGPQGVQGPQGPAGTGTGLDPDPTIITKVSWPIGSSVNFNQGMSLVTQLRLDLNGTLEGRTLQAQPQLVQVWFIPNTPLAPATTTAIQVIHGTSKLDSTGISWAATETAVQIRTMFINGGQVLLRVHCGHMFDTRNRPVSAALDAVTPLQNKAPVYGGIWEAWFIVIPG